MTLLKPKNPIGRYLVSIAGFIVIEIVLLFVMFIPSLNIKVFDFLFPNLK